MNLGARCKLSSLLSRIIPGLLRISKHVLGLSQPLVCLFFSFLFSKTMLLASTNQ